MEKARQLVSEEELRLLDRADRLLREAEVLLDAATHYFGEDATSARQAASRCLLEAVARADQVRSECDELIATVRVASAAELHAASDDLRRELILMREALEDARHHLDR